MGLMPQQIHNIFGELFCPFYFILSTFLKNKTKNPQTTIIFNLFVFTLLV